MTEPRAPSTTRPTTQQLVDLVLDPRDRGYEAAAQRKADAGTSGVRRWYDRPAVALGCIVIGFLLAVAWVQTHRGAPQEAKVHDSLVQRARAAEDTTTGLTDDEARLSAEVSRLQQAALGPGSSALLRDLNRDRLLAGAEAVYGPGLEVRLAEPAGQPAPSNAPGHGDRAPVTGGHILIDRDIRSVVNELWADGAEAISVNSIRLTPSSAIRFAGDAILVDFEQIASPYVIDAVGAPDQLDTAFASSAVASRYQTLAGAKGIGFSFAEKPRLTLPAGVVAPPQYAAATRAVR
jgi:uncharacterized protein YlxW (UPF0749 family)